MAPAITTQAAPTTAEASTPPSVAERNEVPRCIAEAAEAAWAALEGRAAAAVEPVPGLRAQRLNKRWSVDGLEFELRVARRAPTKTPTGHTWQGWVAALATVLNGNHGLDVEAEVRRVREVELGQRARDEAMYALHRTSGWRL